MQQAGEKHRRSSLMSEPCEQEVVQSTRPSARLRRPLSNWNLKHGVAVFFLHLYFFCSFMGEWACAC